MQNSKIDSDIPIKKPLSFAFLNATQFLGAFNDNFYRGLITYLLIDLSGPDKKTKVMSLAGALFVLPFLMLSTSAGKLADSYSKSRIIIVTKCAEIAVMALGLLALQQRSFWGSLGVLFAMAAQSAFFGPSKYGIIPEIVEREAVPRANGWLAMFTHLAIVFGIGLSGVVCEYTKRDLVLGGWLCVLLAIIGTLTSLGIERTFGQGRSKKLGMWFWQEVWVNCRRAGKYGQMQTFFFAYFAGYHIAGYLQFNMIPFAIDNLGKSDTQGNYLFSFTAIGIGVGAFLAGQLNRHRLKLHHVPWAMIGAAVGLAGLSLCTGEWAVLFFLLMTGMTMGFFIVPSESYMQVTAPESDRGEMLATANFLSFAGVFLATCTLYLVNDIFSLSPAKGFSLYALLTALTGLFLRRKLIFASL